MNEGTYLGGRLKKIAKDVGLDGEVHGSSEMNLVIYILEAMKRHQDARDKILPMSSTRYRIQKLEQLAERLTPETLDSLFNLLPRLERLEQVAAQVWVDTIMVSKMVTNAEPRRPDIPTAFEKPGFSADVTQQKLLDQLNAVRRQVNTVSEQLSELPHSDERCVVCNACESLTKVRDEINAMTIKISGHLRYTGEPS